jgi:hypothetical protein
VQSGDVAHQLSQLTRFRRRVNRRPAPPHAYSNLTTVKSTQQSQDFVTFPPVPGARTRGPTVRSAILNADFTFNSHMQLDSETEARNLQCSTPLMALTSLAQCSSMPGINHKTLKTAKSAQEPKTENPSSLSSNHTYSAPAPFASSISARIASGATA